MNATPRRAATGTVVGCAGCSQGTRYTFAPGTAPTQPFRFTSRVRQHRIGRARRHALRLAQPPAPPEQVRPLLDPRLPREADMVQVGDAVEDAGPREVLPGERHIGRCHRDPMQIHHIEAAGLASQHLLHRGVAGRTPAGYVRRRQHGDRGFVRCHVVRGHQTDLIAQPAQRTRMRQDGLGSAIARRVRHAFVDDQGAQARIGDRGVPRCRPAAALQTLPGQTVLALAINLGVRLLEALGLGDQKGQHSVSLGTGEQAVDNAGQAAFHVGIQPRRRFHDGRGLVQFGAVDGAACRDDVPPMRWQAAGDAQQEAVPAVADPGILQVLAIIACRKPGDDRAVVQDFQRDRRVRVLRVPGPAGDQIAARHVQMPAQRARWRAAPSRRRGRQTRPREQPPAHRAQFLTVFHTRRAITRRRRGRIRIQRVILGGVVEHSAAAIVDEGLRQRALGMNDVMRIQFEMKVFHIRDSMRPERRTGR